MLTRHEQMVRISERKIVVEATLGMSAVGEFQPYPIMTLDGGNAAHSRHFAMRASRGLLAASSFSCVARPYK
jgi:hypothetical protein